MEKTRNTVVISYDGEILLGGGRKVGDEVFIVDFSISQQGYATITFVSDEDENYIDYKFKEEEE